MTKLRLKNTKKKNTDFSKKKQTAKLKFKKNVKKKKKNTNPAITAKTQETIKPKLKKNVEKTKDVASPSTASNQEKTKSKKSKQNESDQANFNESQEISKLWPKKSPKKKENSQDSNNNEKKKKKKKKKGPGRALPPTVRAQRQKMAKRRKPATTSVITKKPRLTGEEKDEKLIKKFNNLATTKAKKGGKKPAEVDPTQLVNLETVQAAISGSRKLYSSKKRKGKSLHEITDDDPIVYMQVTLCKLPTPNEDFHLVKPKTVTVYLPNSIVTDSTEVILITKDLERGIRPDHEDTLNHFKQLLHHHSAGNLVNEIIPLRQLKVEYKEFEAKRLLSNRTDVVLCDDTVMRFIPKFLSKHFYSKKKVPVQVNLKAKDLKNELQRGLAASRLFFTMKGNCSIMKIGRLSQTDEQLKENILAAVKKLASQVPGQWANIQTLGIKLERTTSIPLFVKFESVNSVKPIPAQPLYPGEVVSGTLTTQPGRCITVFPDGSITSTRLRDNISRLPVDERPTKKRKARSKALEAAAATDSKTSNKEKAKDLPKSAKDLGERTEKMDPEALETQGSKRKAKKKGSKAKKQKVAREDDSDSEGEEEDLKEQEIAYLRKLTQEGDATAGDQDDSDDSEDAWAEDMSDMEDSDE